MQTQDNTTKNGDCSTPEVRVKRETEQPKLVQFGRGGHTINFNSNCYQTGYDSRETWFRPSKWWAHDYSEVRDVAQYEGVPFVDKCTAVETDAGYKWAIRGPMVNVDLADGEIDACPQPSEMLVAGVSGEFRTLLALQHCEKARKVKAGPLDSVSIAEYLAGWKEHGATVGVIRNGQFVEI